MQLLKGQFMLVYLVYKFCQSNTALFCTSYNKITG